MNENKSAHDVAFGFYDGYALPKAAAEALETALIKRDARIRAEARAEALKKAADRAIGLLRLIRMADEWDDLTDARLSAAILANEPKEELRSAHCRECANYDGCIRPELKMAFHKCRQFEPKEERGAEVGDGHPMQTPDCQRGIYCPESDDDKCRFPEDGCLRFMRRAEVERRIEEAGL